MESKDGRPVQPLTDEEILDLREDIRSRGHWKWVRHSLLKFVAFIATMSAAIKTAWDVWKHFSQG